VLWWLLSSDWHWEGTLLPDSELTHRGLAPRSLERCTLGRHWGD
jgi:hypothetical protein